MVTFEGVTEGELKQLLGKSFYYQETKTPYEQVRMSGPCVLVLYKTGKLLLQGQENVVSDVAKLLIALNFKQSTPIEKKPDEGTSQIAGTIIGSDESLKGDTFGGIVVAAVKCDQAAREQLYFHNITDSKLIYDHNIPAMAAAIRKVCKYEVRSLMPEEYNKGSLTPLLNKLHGDCINALLPADKIVIDKFPGCDIPVTQETKAELKYVEVAAASILAREKALEQLEQLSKLAGFKVPKGSTHVEEALQQAARCPIPLNQLVKMHFTNVQEMLRKSSRGI